MAIITLELNRNDFIPEYFNRYEKGYIRISRAILKPEIDKLYDIADIVYIYLGQDKHFLKNKI